MSITSTFPFGWIRNFMDDNWQILWDSGTNDIYLKGCNSGRLITYQKAISWTEAKSKSDKLLENPEGISELF